ncbi:DUF3592 domain-containing protein [Pseudonocardia hydrocarbonoxydans]|uniref:DUF3592 domain-containing protein n=1 Tax=Pseudonocardia hydrocarbonoxydans TaxID=76726 RepID=A0A4Y3WX05_9PSEU|nr:DUF3592 domain-containing protein [Pseudonocardia hydrocarbonoxydans]GEC22279.1 hypothetical protein PHY01_45620 [Pseudonocardia hydrocarbonoxydans]
MAEPSALDEVAATVAPTVRFVRRRLPELVTALAVLVTVLAGLALIGSAVDDAAIDANPATAQAEVLDGSTFFRTLVRFTVANGQTVVPEQGVFHPRGLSPGEQVAVEYDVTEPELVRVAGRRTVDGIGSTVLGVVATWVVLGPLALWLRRRRAAADPG